MGIAESSGIDFDTLRRQGPDYLLQKLIDASDIDHEVRELIRENRNGSDAWSRLGDLHRNFIGLAIDEEVIVEGLNRQVDALKALAVAAEEVRDLIQANPGVLVEVPPSERFGLVRTIRQWPAPEEGEGEPDEGEEE